MNKVSNMKEMIELVAPAGNLEKLRYAWEYGADAAYIGLKNFSLRVKADNFFNDEYKTISALKEQYALRGTPKKLLCALNISFHNKDIETFLAEADYFKHYPIDAFIIQDIGMVPVLRKVFPHIPLHLSTQANCINYEAVKMYRDIGFKRVVLGREASLADIAEIKNRVPEMELECFVHGAMCIAYSGRCLISAYLTGRSANAGSCTHSCRWDYSLVAKNPESVKKSAQAWEEIGYSFAVKEKERAGEYFPIEEGSGYTALFSSKDLCMIDYLADLQKAGADALKIEGRMKSLYYTALVTRAYRKRLDALYGKISTAEALPFVNELYNTAHREFGTGFYFSKDDANKTVRGETKSPYMMAGTIGKKLRDNRYEFIALNKITAGMPLEYIGPDICAIEDSSYSLLDPETGAALEWVCHGHPCIIATHIPLRTGFIVRIKSSKLFDIPIVADTFPQSEEIAGCL